MPILRNPARRPGRATSVVALLVVALVLVGALTYQAQDAARSHRNAAEATLNDYAAFAAWEYARLANQDLEWEVWNLIEPIYYLALPPRGVPRQEQLVQLYARLTKCDCAYRPRYWFALDLESGELGLSGPEPDSVARGRLRDTVTQHMRAVWGEKWKYAAFVTGADDHPRLIGYVVKKDDAGVARAIYGFELGLGLVETILRTRFEKSPLLPPQVAGVDRNDSLLSLRVTDMGGREVYRSRPHFDSPFEATDSLAPFLAGLHVTVGIQPDAIEDLVIGGLPRSRMPLLVGLLLLTVGLVVIAVVQLRREYELARVRQDFVSGVSHELRTPLAQIRMFVETLLLERVRTPEEGRRALDIVNREAQRLTHLVENVLQFSRAERGVVQLVPEPTRLDGLVRDCVDCFHPLAAARSVTVRMDVEPGVTAVVDQEAIRQVLLNLLDNAVKYGPAGQTVHVALTLERGRARVMVEDEGPGVPPEARARVFEPFWRLPRESQSAVGGSGIGLAVVRELVTLHRGSVYVEAGATRGARFVIEIPGAHRAAVERAAPQPTGAER